MGRAECMPWTVGDQLKYSGRVSTRPYGTWTSPITSSRVSAGSLRLSQPRLDRGELFWLEGRPDEGGRQVLVGPGGDLTPAGMSAQTLAHEYGGGDYAVRDGVVVFSNLEDQRVYRMHAHGGVPEPLTAAGSRYADFEIAPDGHWLVAVEERPREGAEPENRLVAIPLKRSGPPRVVAAGHDFVSFPRFSPDGSGLVFTSWEHPQMPWDGTELHRLDWDADGPTGAPRRLAGGTEESIFQPGHSPVGRITFVADRSGWWNLHQLREGAIVDLCPRAAEFGRPQWVFGMATWAFLDEETILCIVGAGGRACLARLDLASGRLEDLVLPFTSFDGLRVEGDRACFVAAAADRPATICSLDPRSTASCSAFASRLLPQ